MNYFKSGAFFETAVVVLVGIAYILFTTWLDKKYIKTKKGNNKWYHSVKMILDFVNMIIVIILALILLSVNGVNVKKYVASLGVIGVVATFALQDMLKDIIMGLTIMLEGYFKVGDVIIYEGREAKVTSFNIKTTRLLMTDTEEKMAVTNRNISQVSVASDWVDVTVPIGYDMDLYYSRFLCTECAKRIERLRYVYSCDFINTQELAESWIEYRLRIHCLPEKKFPVRRNAQAVIQDVFFEHEAPFPLSIKVLYNVDPNDEKNKPKIVGYNPNEAVIMGNGTAHHKRKSAYELGRGAEKSKVVSIDGSDKSFRNAVAESERYSRSENLDSKMRLRLRLLSEEMLSLSLKLPNIKNGIFYIEREDSQYDICFEADATVDQNAKKQLIDITSTHSNEAYSGISGMIAKAVDSMILLGNYEKNDATSSSSDAMEQSIGKAEDS